jgi:hypothetical protein
MAHDPSDPVRTSVPPVTSSSGAASSTLAEALAGAARAHAPTVPEAAGRTVAERANEAVKRLDDAIGDARASIPGWDNLAWVNAFCRAATHVRDALPSTVDPLERRALAARLVRLVPPALLPDAPMASTPPSSRLPPWPSCQLRAPRRALWPPPRRRGHPRRRR